MCLLVEIVITLIEVEKMDFELFYRLLSGSRHLFVFFLLFGCKCNLIYVRRTRRVSKVGKFCEKTERGRTWQAPPPCISFHQRCFISRSTPASCRFSSARLRAWRYSDPATRNALLNNISYAYIEVVVKTLLYQ